MNTGTQNRARIPKQLPRQIILWILGFLIVISLIALPQYLRAKKSAQWPSVPGVVTASYMRSGLCKHMPCYHGEITYRYRVAGADYQGNALGLGRTHWAARESWQSVLDQYPVGKPVAVYYERGHPAEGILEPGLHGEMEDLYHLDLILIWGSVGAFIICFLWYRDPENSNSPVPDKPEPLQ